MHVRTFKMNPVIVLTHHVSWIYGQGVVHINLKGLAHSEHLTSAFVQRIGPSSWPADQKCRALGPSNPLSPARGAETHRLTHRCLGRLLHILGQTNR